MIRIQLTKFDVAAELSALKKSRNTIGASVVFIGSVRDMNDGKTVSTLTLEHYPGMTEKALAEIETQAHHRWPLIDSLIIHRYGKLNAGDDIVLVITTASHREDAFAACQFLMDWLKTKAPFWKLESDGHTESWVEAHASDEAKANCWEK